jgi:predicted O-methyltransferase YrrM
MKKMYVGNEGIKGWLSQEDSYFLYLSVLFSRPKSILEIGHCFGKSTAAICQAIKDAKIICKFDSFDLDFDSVEHYEEYFSLVHKQKVIIKPVNAEVLRSGKTLSSVAYKNLAELKLERFVNLITSDFRKSNHQNYDLIFADTMHEKEEINNNLNDIIKFSHENTLFMFDDMKNENIALIESSSNLILVRRSGKIGLFIQVVNRKVSV